MVTLMSSCFHLSTFIFLAPLFSLGAEEVASVQAPVQEAVTPSASTGEAIHPGQLFGLSPEQWSSLPEDLQTAINHYAERQQALEQASDALLQGLAGASDEAVHEAHRQFQSEHADVLRQLSSSQTAIRQALQELPTDHPAHRWSTFPPEIRDLLGRRAVLQQQLTAVRQQFLKDRKTPGTDLQKMIAERRDKEREIRLKLLELENEANRLLKLAGLAELSEAEKTLPTE